MHIYQKESWLTVNYDVYDIKYIQDLENFRFSLGLIDGETGSIKTVKFMEFSINKFTKFMESMIVQAMNCEKITGINLINSSEIELFRQCKESCTGVGNLEESEKIDNFVYLAKYIEDTGCFELNIAYGCSEDTLEDSDVKTIDLTLFKNDFQDFMKTIFRETQTYMNVSGVNLFEEAIINIEKKTDILITHCMSK